MPNYVIYNGKSVSRREFASAVKTIMNGLS